MFPGCPEHCNIEGTLSEYSRNIAGPLRGNMPVKCFVLFLHLQILQVVGDDVSKRNMQCKASQKSCLGFNCYYKSGNTKRVCPDCRTGLSN